MLWLFLVAVVSPERYLVRGRLLYIYCLFQKQCLGSVGIYLIWIRIQHFWRNTDLDSGFLWPKIEKNLQLKIFFYIKNYNSHIARTFKLPKKPSALKENIQHNMKSLFFFLFFLGHYTLLDPDTDPLTWLNPEPVQKKFLSTDSISFVCTYVGLPCFIPASPKRPPWSMRLALRKRRWVMRVTRLEAVLRIRIQDQRSGAFLTIGSQIRDGWKIKKCWMLSFEVWRLLLYLICPLWRPRDK